MYLCFKYFTSLLIDQQPYKICIYTIISILHLSTLKFGELSCPVLIQHVAKPELECTWL